MMENECEWMENPENWQSVYYYPRAVLPQASAPSSLQYIFENGYGNGTKRNTILTKTMECMAFDSAYL